MRNAIVEDYLKMFGHYEIIIIFTIILSFIFVLWLEGLGFSVMHKKQVHSWEQVNLYPGKRSDRIGHNQSSRVEERISWTFVPFEWMKDWLWSSMFFWDNSALESCRHKLSWAGVFNHNNYLSSMTGHLWCQTETESSFEFQSNTSTQ